MKDEFILYKNAWIKNIPPHLSKIESKRDCKHILIHGGGGYLLRNIYDFDCESETGFWFVIKDKFGGLEELSSKMRNQVRKSLKTYEFKKVLRQEILDFGYPIFQMAQEHYKVKAQVMTMEEFENRINSCSKNTDFWGVFNKSTGEAVALSINTIEPDCCNYNTMKANPKFLNSTYPYYGLIYEMNRYYLEELGLKYVNDGARSITEHSNIQPFLIDKFLFRKAYCKLQIEYNWKVKIAVTLLYPFREIIPILSVKSILRMEAMRRGKY